MKMKASKTGKDHMKQAKGAKKGMPSVGKKGAAPKKKAMKTGYKAR